MSANMLWVYMIVALLLANLWQSRNIAKEHRETKIVDAKLLSFNKKAAVATARSLDEVHTVINGSLTLSKIAEMHATARDLASLEEVVDLKISQGLRVSDASLAIIETVKVRLKDLQVEVETKAVELAQGKINAQKRINDIIVEEENTKDKIDKGLA